MTTGLLVLHIILAAIMIGMILLQRNEGGGLGMGSSNMGGFMTTRGTANLLTRTTGILAACFFATTIILALMFKGAHNAQSILDGDNVVIVDQTISSSPEIDPTKTNNPLTANEAKALDDPSVDHAIIDDVPLVHKDIQKIDVIKPHSDNKSVILTPKKNTAKK